MDVLTKEQRQRNMRAIRSRDTQPEMFVRRLVHSMGFRYRLHCRNLPGQPDLVFASRKKTVFVHGCFWHRHRCRYGRVVPATRREFWTKKLQKNIQRDRRVRRQLRALGWKSLTIWECQLKDVTRLRNRLHTFLDSL
ncbi:MAG: DNA mismatch endonuclease Vsr [Planctomycetota bacterium]